MTETNRIEFKRELTRDLDLEREVVAFLNYREGGVIYIGIDTPLWNERAMREIVINAIVHNDYYTNEVPPKFEIFSDRIEITSAGRLPIDMTKEEFFGGISSPRNKELMRVFRDVDMVEALGSGMKRIRKVYDESIFSFTTNFIRASIKFHSQRNIETTSFDDIVGSVNNDVDSVNGSVNNTQLTERQLTIISIIDNGNAVGSVNGSVKSKVTTKDIISKLNLSERTIYRELATLKQLNRIRRVGSDKTGYWESVSQH